MGTAATPEYVFASQGGAPDDTGFGIWWIDGARMTELFDERDIAEVAAVVINMNLWTRWKLAQGATPVTGLS